MGYQRDEKPQERTLAVGEIKVEHKTLRVSVKENHRGRFMRITEENRGRHSSVIIPADGLDEFMGLLGQVKDQASP